MGRDTGIVQKSHDAMFAKDCFQNKDTDYLRRYALEKDG